MLKVKTIKTKYYPAYIGEHLLADFNFGQFKASSFVIITDQVVNKLLGPVLKSNPSLKTAPVYELVLPVGEASKTLDKAEKILSFMAKNNIDRAAVILAFGGGVIGDTAGFVASVYKRGVEYVQLPTTLLAQVDSSHGGKTALNLPEGKNLVGTTYFPLAVIADVSSLGSLPKSQLASGLAEIIKCSVISDKKLFAYLESNITHLTRANLNFLVEKSTQIKARITEKDPDETEFRKILNYGHTVGHALEALSDHSLNHGQAVALGMLCEGHIAYRLGLFSQADLARQNNLIQKLGFKPTMVFNPDKLIELMRRDKKAKGGGLYFILPVSIGKVKQQNGKVAFEVDESLVRESLKQALGLPKTS